MMTMKSFMPSLWGKNGDNFDPFHSLQREVDRVFGEFSRGMPFPETQLEGSSFWMTPKMNVSENEQTFKLSVELPGVSEEDIDVTVEKGSLTIKAEKKAETDEEIDNYHLKERSYGMFQRSVPLPFEVEADKVQAKFDKGVLSVQLPKPPELEAKKQKIQIGHN